MGLLLLRLVDLLQLLLVHTRPLVLHLISGGAFIFASMCELMRHLPAGGALPVRQPIHSPPFPTPVQTLQPPAAEACACLYPNTIVARSAA